MKLCKMIEMYLKYDNMHTNVIINAFICINNHVNSCIKCMLSKSNHFCVIRIKSNDSFFVEGYGGSKGLSDNLLIRHDKT